MRSAHAPRWVEHHIFKNAFLTGVQVGYKEYNCTKQPLETGEYFLFGRHIVRTRGKKAREGGGKRHERRTCRPVLRRHTPPKGGMAVENRGWQVLRSNYMCRRYPLILSHFPCRIDHLWPPLLLFNRYSIGDFPTPFQYLSNTFPKISNTFPIPFVGYICIYSRISPGGTRV